MDPAILNEESCLLLGGIFYVADILSFYIHQGASRGHWVT